MFEVSMKLESKEKSLANAEGESGSLSRRWGNDFFYYFNYIF